MGHLGVRLLGPFQVTLDGQPVTGFRSDKVRALLAYLCTETDRPHRREKLAGILWPDWPESSARANLRRALADLRSVISDQDAAPHTLSVTRQTIQFNLASDTWVDVLAFAELTGSGGRGHEQDPSALERAVRLYRGEFLEGFSLPDSAAFEEWALFHRERWHRLVLEALQRLVQEYGQAGQYERGLDHAWRQVALDPWREEAHRQLMLLLALSGQRGAALSQFETCRATLAQELGVEPGAATVQIYRKICDDQVELIPRLPSFLQQGAPQASRPVFVGRESELARLDAYLERALAGQGQAVFVTGGPGRGKTALLGEFARRAMAAHPELLVAGGRCNAFAGQGNPYLPFREILAMLTGDVEPRWAAGSISRDHAWRLWSAVPLAARALLECGPQVTGALLDGPSFLSRATAAAASPGVSWLQRLREHVERQRAGPEDLEADSIVIQMANVLFRLAEEHPLLLIVDDLQWADLSSIGLLFHLGRRLAGSRILVACAYRPEEAGPDLAGPLLVGEGSQPLTKVLAELKSQLGDIWIDLARSDPVQDRAFIDAYLDTEPNRLGEGFRQALFARTAGHPLFTVELLRAMQERQDLQHDEEDRWVEGPALRWDVLPARVEGAIEQRIGRLDPELQSMLAVACVEGEQFTAQVVARLQGRDERQVLRCLSQDLERKHRLIQAQDEQQIGSHHLSRYRFGHVLFRDYLYSTLSPGERRLLHHRIGTALEGLYGDQVGQIAALLAHHFDGDPEKERHYARLAGERAAAQYANEEALLHLSRALELTLESDREERFALLLAHDQIYDRRSDREARGRNLDALEELAAVLGDPRRKAEVALRQAWHAWQKSDFPGAIRFATEAAGLGRSVGDPEVEAQARRLWGIALSAQGDQVAAQRHFEQGLALARAAGARWLEAEILRHASWRHMMLGQYGKAEAYLEKSLRIFQEIGDQHDEMRIHLSFAGLCQQQFNYVRALEHGEQVQRLSRELGSPLHGISALDYAGKALKECGDYQRAHSCFEQILTWSREMGVRSWEGRSLLDLAYVAHALGDSGQALPSAQQALALARETGDRGLAADAMSHLGHYLEALGQCEEAGAAYEKSMTLRVEMGLLNAAVEAQAGLARVCLVAGDLAQAMGYVDAILRHLESGTLEGADQPLLVYLTCYRVLQAAGDARAIAVLEEGHQLLREIAAKITDEELRRSFLENVAWHRDLAQEYEQVRGEDGSHSRHRAEPGRLGSCRQ